MLSGAPYGYRYVRKSDEANAYYEVIEAEAEVVRQVFELYTVAGWSIGAITRRLNEQGVPTKKQGARWERSTVWAILRNPAYKGLACFGKTQLAARQRTNNRALRQRGGLPARNSANHERPRDQWIEIPVPALIDEVTFSLAEEHLVANKKHAAREKWQPPTEREQRMGWGTVFDPRNLEAEEERLRSIEANLGPVGVRMGDVARNSEGLGGAIGTTAELFFTTPSKLMETAKVWTYDQVKAGVDAGLYSPNSPIVEPILKGGPGSYMTLGQGVGGGLQVAFNALGTEGPPVDKNILPWMFVSPPLAIAVMAYNRLFPAVDSLTGHLSTKRGSLDGWIILMDFRQWR